ncbi:MAG: CBS domain-containing protein [Burkholderiaceae bacterium]|nr:CBS domain-containing protein [Burkholderiaceae bacterium]
MASNTLLAGVSQFLKEHPPFSMMADADVEFVARNVEVAYYARGEVLIGPGDGAPAACFIIKQGLVEGLRRRPDRPEAELEPTVQRVPGEMLPISALMAQRPVMSTYRAAGDVFCWLLPKARFDELLQRSPVFLDFCKRRMASLLDLSHRALQASYAAGTTHWRSINAPLESMLGRAPVTCAPEESLRAVFERMEHERVGAVIVVRSPVADSDQVVGIFTRKDVLGRVVLPGRSLDEPVSNVMSAPVVTLKASDTVGEAMLVMADRTIRHIPVMRDGRLAGVVAERDLFVLQRRSMNQIGDAISRAASVDDLKLPAADIRHWSRSLVAQGVSAGFITRLISRLNDQLSVRLIELKAAEHGVPLDRLCWLALGSEGREEQTIASDQDNGLIVADEFASSIDALLAFAQAVNQALDACGYPLCKGGIMAGNPKWCLGLSQWKALFDGWIERGDPQSLLNANIFFDFRALAGDSSLAQALRDHVTPRAAAVPRFLKQMSDNALRNGPPQSWTAGVLETLFSREAAVVDLKLNGTVPFVDAARLLALANGIRATGTVERFETLATMGVVPAAEVRGWVDSFQFFQSLRLRAQHMGEPGSEGNPNSLDTRTLSGLDRRILKEAFREARRLQQRLALDYPG